MSNACHHHRTLPECKICALEVHGAIPLTPAEAFTLQRDSGDEQPFHSHDQASRERDTRRGYASGGLVTNTPRAGETPQQVAVRYRMDVPEGAKDCKEFCGDACRCGLRDPAPEAAE